MLKTTIRILLILLVSGIVAGSLYLIVQGTSLQTAAGSAAISRGGQAFQDHVRGNGAGFGVGQGQGLQPGFRGEGEGRDRGYNGGASIFLNFIKVAVITVVIVLIQFLMRKLKMRKTQQGFSG
jgi:hypothetical protein